jgi:hypothetical protein
MISAFCFLAARRHDAESHRAIGIARLAESGDENALKRQLEQWEDEAE